MQSVTLQDDEAGPESLARRVLTGPRPEGRPLLVGVDGRSGSGKTTVSATLARLLRAGGRTVRTVRLDDLYPGWDALAQALPIVRDEVLGPLRRGVPARYTSWDWHRDRPGHPVVVPLRDVVLVEGVGAVLADPTAYDVTVWVTASAPVRIRRAQERDGVVMAQPWQRWVVQEDALFGQDVHPRAPLVVDAVVDTTDQEGVG